GRTEKPKEIDINVIRASPIKMAGAFARAIAGQMGRGEPNMPKRQPCPECGGWKKRDRKTKAGAFYNCRPCDVEFFVVHPAAAVANIGQIAAGAI
ncbi:hypothetical protein LCGC14_1172470, partial [marine sediment metagenome]